VNHGPLGAAHSFAMAWNVRVYSIDIKMKEKYEALEKF